MRILTKSNLLFQYIFLLAAALLCLAWVAAAQTTPPADVLSKVDPNSAQQDQTPVNAVPGATANSESGERQVSLKTIVPNILHDQKPIWMFPVHVAEGKHLKPTLILGGVTAALIALDPYDEPYFRNSSGFKTYKTGPLRGRNTTLAITMVPLALYLSGHMFKDSYAVHTGLLAAESIVDTQLVSLIMKGMTGRLHPSDIPPHGDFSHTWFKYPGSITNPGSFPSGHSISAFGAASVFATRYRQHRWVPWVAYGIATIVSLTRVPDQAHFPSDIFAGASLGYAITHYVVLRRP
jgi:membrane-associated phospholipid phosphatase